MATRGVIRGSQLTSHCSWRLVRSGDRLSRDCAAQGFLQPQLNGIFVRSLDGRPMQYLLLLFAFAYVYMILYSFPFGVLALLVRRFSQPLDLLFAVLMIGGARGCLAPSKTGGRCVFYGSGRAGERTHEVWR